MGWDGGRGWRTVGRDCGVGGPASVLGPRQLHALVCCGSDRIRSRHLWPPQRALRTLIRRPLSKAFEARGEGPRRRGMEGNGSGGWGCFPAHAGWSRRPRARASAPVPPAKPRAPRRSPEPRPCGSSPGGAPPPAGVFALVFYVTSAVPLVPFRFRLVRRRGAGRRG